MKRALKREYGQHLHEHDTSLKVRPNEEGTETLDGDAADGHPLGVSKSGPMKRALKRT